MAKVDSLFNLSGNLGSLTFVRSQRYGNHVRAKRGSRSGASVNAAFAASSELLIKANGYAKLIKDALELHRGVQRDGTLWSRLVAFFRKELKKNAVVDLKLLKSFRISKMTLSRVISFSVTTSFLNGLQVCVDHRMPFFKQVRNVKKYDLTVIAVFLKADQSFLAVEHNVVRYDIFERDQNIAQACTFSIPPGTNAIILAVKCHAMFDREHSESVLGMAMEIADVVEMPISS